MKEKNKKVFISYAWTDEKYKQWIERVSTKLLEYELDVILDVWELKVGHDMYSYMERGISESDKVLVFCNEEYCIKADKRDGGVGVESSIIRDDVYNNTKQEKFIPIYVKKEDGTLSKPQYLKGRLGVMINKEDPSEEKILEVVSAIFDQTVSKKPIITAVKKNPFVNEDRKTIYSSNKNGNKSIEEIINMVLNNPFENWTYFDEYGEFILKDDINLKIVRSSFEEKQEFFEKWATKHPDNSAYKYKYTISYNNTRIDEFYLVHVDGLRQELPMPKSNTKTITRNNYLKARAVNVSGRLDEYINRSGLIVE